MIDFSNDLIEQFSQMQKIFSHEKRIKILLHLQKQNSSWSGFMKGLEIQNPKLLHDHLNHLSDYSLITKNSSGLYELTSKGKSIITHYVKTLTKFSQLQKDLESKNES